MNNNCLLIIEYMGFILMLNMLHWTSVHVYVNLCTPMTWWGPFYSLVATASPMCQVVNNVQIELSKTYSSVWINLCAFCLMNIKKLILN